MRLIINLLLYTAIYNSEIMEQQSYLVPYFKP